MSVIYDEIKQKLDKGQSYTIMVVGDSITWGLNHCTDSETYCACLARLFAQRFPESRVIRYDGIMKGGSMPLEGYSVPVTVQEGHEGTINIIRSGVGGDSVRRAIKRSDDYTGTVPAGVKTDLFTLMFGINDALMNDPSKYVTAQVFYSDLKELYLLIKKANPSARFVMMTPTYNDSGKKNSSHLDAYSDMVKKLSEENGLLCIDTHRLWMEHIIIGSENHGQRGWLSDTEGDSCHFSPEGSAATAEYIFSCLL